jgi:hypothetical protein
MTLNEHDTVLTAYAETAAGPGWGNSPVWLIVRSSLDGKIRQECLQPDEQSRDMYALYGVSQAAHVAMTKAVVAHLSKPTDDNQ